MMALSVIVPDDLYKAYLAAAQDRDREDVLKDWDHINVESWEESS